METTVQSMSKAIGALERKIHQDPSGSWDEQATTLSTFRTMIVNELQVFLDNEHEQDQADFINRRQQHSGCGGDQRCDSGCARWCCTKSSSGLRPHSPFRHHTGMSSGSGAICGPLLCVCSFTRLHCADRVECAAE